MTWTKLRRFCLEKARSPNRPKYHREGPAKGVARSSEPKHRVGGYQVWLVMCAAKGRCLHCGSLAIEGKPDGRKWGATGRRIGSLEHILPLHRGGDNDFANLAWSCLWCNHLDREKERKKGLTASGALDLVAFTRHCTESRIARKVKQSWPRSMKRRPAIRGEAKKPLLCNQLLRGSSMMTLVISAYCQTTNFPRQRRCGGTRSAKSSWMVPEG